MMVSAALVLAGLLILPANTVLAKGKTGGRFTYADCMNGCWRSHDYCKKHQSKTIDCGRQLGVCIEYCERRFDPQAKRRPRALTPGKKMRVQ